MQVNMIAPNPGQRFTSKDGLRSYTADATGLIVNVSPHDEAALLDANCTFQSSTTPSLALTVSGTYPVAFASAGDIEYNLSLSGPTTLSIAAPSIFNGYQRVFVFIIPNGYQATLPASNPPSLLNNGGMPPVPSTSQQTQYVYAYNGVAIAGGAT